MAAILGLVDFETGEGLGSFVSSLGDVDALTFVTSRVTRGHCASREVAAEFWEDDKVGREQLGAGEHSGTLRYSFKCDKKRAPGNSGQFHLRLRSFWLCLSIGAQAQARGTEGPSPVLQYAPLIFFF